jgi:Fe-S oxidoreductase
MQLGSAPTIATPASAAGERVLFPAVRDAAEEDLVVAPGFSCRHQIADFCDGRRALHTAELLAMAEEE